MLTHHIPDGWPRPDSTVHSVTDGIETAVNQAKTAAAGKPVGVHGADTIQQRLNAGLLDVIHVDIAAVFLGSRIRLFDHLADTPTVLGSPAVIQGIGVTHIRYPVRTTWSAPACIMTPLASFEARPNVKLPGSGQWYGVHFTGPGQASCRRSGLNSNFRHQALHH